MMGRFVRVPPQAGGAVWHVLPTGAMWAGLPAGEKLWPGLPAREKAVPQGLRRAAVAGLFAAALAACMGGPSAAEQPASVPVAKPAEKIAESARPAGVPANKPAPPPGSPIAYAKLLSQAFHEAALKVLPAVVHIRNIPVPAAATASSATTPNEHPDQSAMSDPRRMLPPLQGVLGSGVIIDARGVILTNNHVVGTPARSPSGSRTAGSSWPRTFGAMSGPN